MANVAYLPIQVDRYGAAVRQIHIRGLDLTGIVMRAQVRLGGDVPGAPLVDLQTVTNANAEGLRLIEVTDENGLPVSHVEMVINETTLERLPYSGEIGSPTPLAWDWQITLAGRKQRIAKGEFVITGDGVTGADNAPVNRPAGWTSSFSQTAGMRTGATLTFGEESIHVTIDGADLVAPLAQEAKDARDAVKPLYGDGAPSPSIGIPGSWYRDMTDPLSPLEYFKTAAGWQGPRSLRGQPGGNVMAIGLFKEASSLIIPNGVNAVRTSGHTVTGLGIADYFASAEVDANYIATFPRSSFITVNGRGFRLRVDTVDVRCFGAIGDALADDRAATQEAYNTLAAGSRGGDLVFPRGIYRVDLELFMRGIHLRGEGRGNSILTPFDPDGSVLRLTFSDGSWSSVVISSMSLRGSAPLRGTGIAFGHNDYQDKDELTVSVAVRDVEFVDLDKCISRASGNIGVVVDLCNFSRANYHLHSVARPGKMHAGCIEVRGGHMQGSEKAVCYIDGKEMTGSGQVIFNGPVMEANTGHVFYVKNFRGPEAVPGIIVRSCWNEVNSEQALVAVRKASVEIDGVATAPVYAHLENVTHIRFDDTPVGALRAVNSGGTLVDCALDHYAPEVDVNSAFPVLRGRSFTNAVAAKVETLGPLPAGSQFAPMWWMPHPTHISLVHRSAALIRRDCTTSVLLFGSDRNQDTVPRADDAVLPGVTTSQVATIRAGQSAFPPAVATTAGKWLAWSVTCRLISGGAPMLQITGAEALTGEQKIDHADWRTYRGMRDNERSLASESVRFTAGAADCEIGLGGLALMQFDTRQQALDWVNGGSFPG